RQRRVREVLPGRQVSADRPREDFEEPVRSRPGDPERDRDRDQRNDEPAAELLDVLEEPHARELVLAGMRTALERGRRLTRRATDELHASGARARAGLQTGGSEPPAARRPRDG